MVRKRKRQESHNSEWERFLPSHRTAKYTSSTVPTLKPKTQTSTLEPLNTFHNFLSLPPELRNTIYKLTLKSPTPIMPLTRTEQTQIQRFRKYALQDIDITPPDILALDSHTTLMSQPSHSHPGAFGPALLRTGSSVIRNEAHALFMEQNVFVLQATTFPKWSRRRKIRSWLNVFTEEQRASISHVRSCAYVLLRAPEGFKDEGDVVRRSWQRETFMFQVDLLPDRRGVAVAFEAELDARSCEIVRGIVAREVVKATKKGSGVTNGNVIVAVAEKISDFGGHGDMGLPEANGEELCTDATQVKGKIRTSHVPRLVAKRRGLDEGGFVVAVVKRDDQMGLDV